MIVICINCNKKFELNSDLLESGRTIQCGSCNHIWFFKKNTKKTTPKDVNLDKINIENNQNNLTEKELEHESKINEDNIQKDKINKKIVKKNFTLGKFLSYIFVTIISFFALIIFLDTFKNNLIKRRAILLTVCIFIT